MVCLNETTPHLDLRLCDSNVFGGKHWNLSFFVHTKALRFDPENIQILRDLSLLQIHRDLVDRICGREMSAV